ncbi:hypothetical protein SXM_3062 [Shewanella xiamenensis]|nr:hypothetical protein SXM_3062 [Shewanella xiamenensis]
MESLWRKTIAVQLAKTQGGKDNNKILTICLIARQLGL